MARKTEEVTIVADGRDKGKVFLLTEWPAEVAENWGMRAVAALGKSGFDVPNADGGNLIAVAVAGIRSLVNINTQEVVGLLGELMDCVQVMPDAKSADPQKRAIVRKLFPDDIEEVATRLKLKDEVFKLHTGFSFADSLSKLSSMVKSAIASQPAPQTSQASSEPQ